LKFEVKKKWFKINSTRGFPKKFEISIKNDFTRILCEFLIEKMINMVLKFKNFGIFNQNYFDLKPTFLQPWKFILLVYEIGYL
jgi:hypothetical protein